MEASLRGGREGELLLPDAEGLPVVGESERGDFCEAEGTAVAWRKDESV